MTKPGRLIFISTILLLLILPMITRAQSQDGLVTWMTGSFSSAEQAAADSNYFDIRLEMVPIWTEREDGHWLYVEQAAAANLDRPYRQRVYHVTEPGPGKFRSEVYAFPNPLRFAGDWQSERPLGALTPDSLTIREGCAVMLSWSDQGCYGGATFEQNCKSSLRGATYATSEVTVWADRIVSWDRGFNEAGEQVWGARQGGYVFLRNSPVSD